MSKALYKEIASDYWNQEYKNLGYKVVHDAGTEEKTIKLAEREIDFFLWPTKEKSDALMNDKENNPYPTFDPNFWCNHKPITDYFQDDLSELVALDYGCGLLGRYTFALCKYFYNVYGIDISSEAIKECKRRRKFAGTFIMNNGVDIRLPDNHVDFIFSNLVLQHIGYREGIDCILKEFGRILKPGGIARVEFLDSSQKRDSEFFSVAEGCGVSVDEVSETFKKCGVEVLTHSEGHPYLWITAQKK